MAGVIGDGSLRETGLLSKDLKGTRELLLLSHFSRVRLCVTP